MQREFDRATLLRHDPYLEPFMHNIEERHRHFRHLREQVTDGGKTPLLEFARGFDSFGLHYRPEVRDPARLPSGTRDLTRRCCRPRRKVGWSTTSGHPGLRPLR